MKFSVFVTGVVALLYLPKESNAIQLDDIDAYQMDQFAQLDEMPVRKVTKTAVKPGACKDKPWVNNHGHTCADIAKDPHAKGDWISSKGVRADVACCKFGGGNR